MVNNHIILINIHMKELEDILVETKNRINRFIEEKYNPAVIKESVDAGKTVALWTGTILSGVESLSGLSALIVATPGIASLSLIVGATYGLILLNERMDKKTKEKAIREVKRAAHSEVNELYNDLVKRVDAYNLEFKMWTIECAKGLKPKGNIMIEAM